MKKQNYRRVIFSINKWVLFVIFMYAGLDKLINFNSHFLSLSKMPAIGNYINFYTALLLPISEIVLALWLYFKEHEENPYLMSFGMMFSFTIYISYLFIFMPLMSCACAGIISFMGFKAHLIMNIILAIMSLYNYFNAQYTNETNLNKSFVQ